jgi:glutathione S-transferase
MSFEYASVAEAMSRNGLRMVVVSDIPSPWTEAAKGMLHMKGIPWVAVRLDYRSDALGKWSPERNAPVAFYNDEPPRSGWSDILSLAERLAPNPQLLPTDPTERTLALSLANDFCGEGGLGWSRRLQLIHSGLQNAGGFPVNVSKYLAKKYGYTPEAGVASTSRVMTLLQKFASRLKSQRNAASNYYVGNSPTAVDIYSATFLAMFKPLPPSECKMDEVIRAVFESRDLQTETALDRILFEHREMMYGSHLELPLSL